MQHTLFGNGVGDDTAAIQELIDKSGCELRLGSVDRLTIRDSVVENCTDKPMTFLRNKGAISSLSLTGCAAEGTEMIANEGTIENLCVR